MKKRLRIFLITAIAIGCAVNRTRAQDTVQNIPYTGTLDSIHSGILKQTRFIEIFTPPGYKPGSSDTYDVLYVLDGGNWNTGLITPIQRFVEGEGNMPPTLIVSVMGIDRNKELTPTHLENWKGSGEADKFLAFIKNELIPYIDTTYPSNGDNTLWGHSLSGMFVLYALLNEPTSFKSYIAADPSLWWDQCYVPKMAARKLPELTHSDITLFISGREGRSLNEMKIDTMETILKQVAPRNLKWKLAMYPDETHSSLRLKTTYDGLKFTYAGLTDHIEFHPMNGIVLNKNPIKTWYFGDPTNVYYTLDGTTPTTSSAKAQPEIILNGPARVTYKRFTQRSRYDITATGTFTTEHIPQPVSKPKNIISGGFEYAYYEGDWDMWTDLKGLKPVKTGTTNDDLDIDSLPRKENFALVIDGFLETKEDGYYIFILEADKNSKLYLGQKLLMQWDGNYKRRASSFILPLSKGFYPFRIEYLCRNKDFHLKLNYLTPSTMDSKNTIPIPLEAQYRMK